MNKWKLLRFAVLVLLIGIALWQTHPYFGDLAHLFRYRGLNYWWLIAAALVQLAQYAADGYLIRRLVAILGFTVRLKDAIRISALDVFAIHFLPVGSFGSLVAFIYFYRRLGIRTQAVVFLNLVLTVVSVFELAFLGIVALSVLHNAALPISIPSYLLGLIAIAAPILAAALFVVLASDNIRNTLNQWLLRYRWYISLQKGYDELRLFASIAATQRVRFVAYSALKDSTIYLCDMLILFACGLAFHTVLSPFLIIFAYVLSQLIGTVSLTPGGLGSADATLTIIFIAGGVTPAVTVGVVLLNRIVSFLIPLPLGALAYFTLKRDIDKEPADSSPVS